MTTPRVCDCRSDKHRPREGLGLQVWEQGGPTSRPARGLARPDGENRQQEAGHFYIKMKPAPSGPQVRRAGRNGGGGASSGLLAGTGRGERPEAEGAACESRDSGARLSCPVLGAQSVIISSRDRPAAFAEGENMCVQVHGLTSVHTRICMCVCMYVEEVKLPVLGKLTDSSAVKV